MIMEAAGDADGRAVHI